MLALVADNSFAGFDSHSAPKRPQLRAVDPAFRKVLIVDDDEDLTRLYTRFLDHAGYLVTAVHSGAAALEAVASEQFEVLLSDIGLPDLDGLELVRQMRRRQPDAAVVLVTGSPSVESAATGMAIGVSRYLCKPASRSEVVNMVTEAAYLRRQACARRSSENLLASAEEEAKTRKEEASLRQVFDAIVMAYQPIVRSSDRGVCAHEALMRNNDPEWTGPVELLEAAQSLDLSAELAGRVHRQIAADMRSGRIEGTVFVNLQGDELLDDLLLSPLHPLRPVAERVVLEITERAPVAIDAALIDRVARLRQAGYRIAIDDLGVGYSSLSALASLEPDLVKLDMSMTRGIDAQPRKQRLVGAMVDLCHELGIELVAEGIETEAERSVVESLGCDLLQGFLLGRPARLESR